MYFVSFLDRLFHYADFIEIALLVLTVTGLILMIFSSRNLISPRQQRRILKLKLAYLDVAKQAHSKSFSFHRYFYRLLSSAGLADRVRYFKDMLKVFILITFLLATLFSILLGFSLAISFLFGLVSVFLSPLVPIAVLLYLRSSRNAVLSAELYIVMSHIVDAVESAGRTLQSAIEDSMHAAPVLALHLQKFLNTYLTSGVDEAAAHFREAVPIEEVELFLDLLIHGFEHTTQELTRYFAAEADSYHELEISARQRRMDRREVFFDILMAFPAILGFALLIYPVFAKGVEAISHVL